MSLPQQTVKRLPKIKAGLLIGKKAYTIAEECGVTEKTIDRDLKKWRQSGDFVDWIKQEWVRLHHVVVTENPVEAYRQLTRLLGQTFIRKMEVKKEIKTEHRTDIHILLERYEEVIERAANRNLPKDDTGKQVHTAHADS